ncbi:MAG: hypothetical protein ACLU70_14105 [Lachnospira sp.]
MNLFYVGAGGLCGAASAALLYFKFHIDVTLSIYIGVPVAFPVILFGFYKYQGYLPVAQLLKRNALYVPEQKAVVLFNRRKNKR